MIFDVKDKIKHVVVLMFENRSFDHLLGALPGVDGVFDAKGQLKPECFNTMNPTQLPDPVSNKQHFPTIITPESQLHHDFNHDFGDGMMPDLFGPGTNGYNGGPLPNPQTTYPPSNCGFISTSRNSQNAMDNSVMYCYQADSLKVFHTLAKEFVICDQFHCDLPGHTNPNRSFMHAATTGNMNLDENNAGVLENKTIYNLLDETTPNPTTANWKIYVLPDASVPGDATFLNQVIGLPNSEVPISQFSSDVNSGNLPFYSFLMCWGTAGVGQINDRSMHPHADLRYGENYLAQIYNVLRSSVHWEDTLLVVTFDENGGIYDHVMPPTTVFPASNVPNDPNPQITDPSNNETFDYTLLGFRIPTLLISPWLSPGIDSTGYQNTSILRFLEDLVTPIGHPKISLTKRDEKATSIAATFQQSGLAIPRNNCPQKISEYVLDGARDISWVPTESELMEINKLVPADYIVEIARAYIGGLKGHADSGRTITREFPTLGDLKAYALERKMAHLAQASLNKTA